MESKEEGWKIKRKEYDQDPAKVFWQGWCEVMAVAMKRRHSTLTIYKFHDLGTHVYVSDGIKCYDARHPAGTSKRSLIEASELAWGNPSYSILDEGACKGNFCKKYPECKWEETLTLADVWLDSIAFLVFCQTSPSP